MEKIIKELSNGILLEDCGILLRWGMKLAEIAQVSKLRYDAQSDYGLKIGDHIILKGLCLNDVILLDENEDEKFTTLLGDVTPAALDRLESVVGIQLQPSMPFSALENYPLTPPKVEWKSPPIRFSYETIEGREPGMILRGLAIRYESTH